MLNAVRDAERNDCHLARRDFDVFEFEEIERPISVKNSSSSAALSAGQAIANERLKRNRAGQVVLQLKSPYKDGTTHIVMEPLESWCAWRRWCRPRVSN
jgi:hypothetical protein